MTNLDSLAPGRHAIVGAIDSALPADLASRLLELGFEPGADVELLHRAPLGGDPLAVRVGGTQVAIRRALARAISVEPGAAA